MSITIQSLVTSPELCKCCREKVRRHMERGRVQMLYSFANEPTEPFGHPGDEASRIARVRHFREELAAMGIDWRMPLEGQAGF